MDVNERFLDLYLVLAPELDDSVSSVESLSDHLVGLHKLVQLLGEILIVDLQNSDVVVYCVDLSLEI